MILLLACLHKPPAPATTWTLTVDSCDYGTCLVETSEGWVYLPDAGYEEGQLLAVETLAVDPT
jgi:hypothetical protein